MPQRKFTYAIAFVLVVAAVVPIAYTVHTTFQNLGITVIGSGASLLSFALQALVLIGEIRSRHSRRRADRNAPALGNWASFAVHVSVGVLGAVFFIAAALNLSYYLYSVSLPAGLAAIYGVVFQIVLPLLVSIVLGLLYLQFRAHRIAVLQSFFVDEMIRTRNDWELPIQVMDPLVGVTLETPKVDADYRRLLHSLCRYALCAATSSSLRVDGDLYGCVSILFVADPRNRHFVPIGWYGLTPEHERVAEQFRPHFLDPKRFTQTYNSYRRRADQANMRRRQRRSLVDEFRRETQSYNSAAGLTFVAQRPLVFDVARCLSYDDSVHDNLPPALRPLVNFRQLVGIPITVFGRPIGVLLLMSTRSQCLASADHVYLTISHIIGVTLQLGNTLGFFTRTLNTTMSELIVPALDIEESEALTNWVNSQSCYFDTDLKWEEARRA